MIALFDFLVLAGVLALLFWAFVPRFRFVHATLLQPALITLVIERYRKLGGKQTLTFQGLQGLHGIWFNLEGNAADFTMARRLDNFWEYAQSVGAVEVHEPEPETIEEPSAPTEENANGES